MNFNLYAQKFTVGQNISALKKNRVTQDVVWDYSKIWAENVQKIQTVNILFYKYSNNSVCYENCQKGKQTKKNQKIPDLAIFYRSKFCYFGNI